MSIALCRLSGLLMFLGSMLLVSIDVKAGAIEKIGPRLVITNSLLSRLNILSTGLENEIGLCLTGTIKGNEGKAIDFYMPPHLFSVPKNLRASFFRCPKNTIAWWHNHPTGVCALSFGDVHATLSYLFPFAVINVRRGMWCWWSRDQVDHLIKTRNTEQKKLPIYALPGQVHYFKKRFKKKKK